ncbi:cell wall-binding repeat-containing protein [Microbacterium sp. Se63.02b]|nr:cell wall-binding repeat-containing protein [Microbacterium sp. Se63.02b]QYM65561.1 cell wall-binding repeat-containing protein [Microbacterium sp. Se5.02b]
MSRRAVPAALAAVVFAASLLTATGMSASADVTRPSETGTAADISFPAGVSRLAGNDRYDTAIAVSKKYAAGTDAVFVATGANFPDALSAAAAAARLGAPLLLTPGTALPAAVRTEITRLSPSTIFIAGSEGAVGAGVERALTAIAPVERLGGASRYETGNALVRRVFPGATHAFIATGRTFPDALAATGAAGATSAPVILVDGAAASLPTDTRDLLDALGVSAVTIVGGAGAVSPASRRSSRTRTTSSGWAAPAGSTPRHSSTIPSSPPARPPRPSSRRDRTSLTRWPVPRWQDAPRARSTSRTPPACPNPRTCRCSDSAPPARWCSEGSPWSALRPPRTWAASRRELRRSPAPPR